MPPVYYGDEMTDPATGIVIPKNPLANVQWRKKLLANAASSQSVRKALKKASAASPLFWLNAFGYTFLQKRVNADAKEEAVQGTDTIIPFITWKVQDDALLQLADAIDNQHHALIHKTRDMGATWLVVALFQWYWQFRPNTTFLEMSRKEVLVDRRGDMDSLFEKHRFMLKWQPEWLRPKSIVDNSMHLENKDIGTNIEGESTNENAGQASRKTAVFIDEAARIRELEAIDLALADTSGCLIYNSTPQGPNTHFTRIYRSLKSGQRQGKLIVMPWWLHPLKGRDAKIVEVDGREVVRNDWYYGQEKRRSKRNMAQNIDGEHGKSGDAFFDYDEIELHRRTHASDPLMAGAIRWRDEFTDEAKLAIIKRQSAEHLVFVENGGWKPWRFWVPLIDGRPNQKTRYVFGIDISNGSGASNSIISVLDHYTNMIVAKFWDAFTSPEDLAEQVAMAQAWFGGLKPARIIFEKNGPGISFGKKLVSKLQAPGIYYQEILDQKSRTKTQKWGWHSSDAKKEILLRDYREALKANEIINPCNEALSEAQDYVYDDNGKIEPGSLGVEEGGGKALHGDHVIADALLVAGRRDLPTKESEEKHTAPRFSYAARRERRQTRDTETAWSH